MSITKENNKTDWPRAVNETYQGKFVFISYSHKDSEWVRQDLNELSKYEIPIWYDEGMTPGDDWFEKVKKKIFLPNCIGAIFFTSRNSCASDAIHREVKLVQEKLKSSNFHYFAVCLGAKGITKFLDKENEERIRLYNTVFPQNKINVARTRKILDNTHIGRCLVALEDFGVVPEQYLDLIHADAFKLSPVIGGYRIDGYHSASEYIYIPAVIDGKRIVKIGNGAFQNFSSVKNLVIAEGISSIGDYSFANCLSLNKVILPQSLKELGYEAFRGCSQLTTVTIPCNVEKIGEYCFYMCGKLSNITFETGASQSIGFACFSQCLSLKTVVLSETLRKIEDYAFSNCPIEKLYIPLSVETIGYRIMLYCQKLTEITIGGNPTINRQLFKFCDKVNAVYFLDDSAKDSPAWEIVGNKASLRLRPVQKINYGNGVLSWNEVNNATQYRIIVDGAETVTTQTSLVCEGKSVSIEALGEGISPSEPTVYALPTVAKIGAGLYKLQNGACIINDGVTEIEPNAFYGNDLFSNLVVSDSLVKIGKNAFYGCSNLVKADLKNVVEIDDYAFAKSTRLKSVIVNEKCQLGEGVFSECLNLEKTLLLSEINKISDFCYYRCISLRKIDLPTSVREIGKNAFRGCMSIEKVDLPEGIEVIGDSAFSYMPLEEINFSSTIKRLGKNNFFACGTIKRITVDATNTRFLSDKGTLYSADKEVLRYPACDENAEYSLLPGTQSVADRAFSQSVYLKVINFNQGLKTIGKESFDVCVRITSVTLPDTVTFVGEKAFNNCASLKEIRIKSPPFKIGRMAFGATEKTIYVKKGTKEKFLALPNWAYYSKCIKEI